MKNLSKKGQALHIGGVAFREIYIWINALLMIFPLVFMIISSGKTQQQLTQDPFGFPIGWSVFASNYGDVIHGYKYIEVNDILMAYEFYTPYFTMIKNSAKLTLVALVFLIVCAAPIGYVLGARKFPGQKLVMLFIIFIQTVPLFGYLIAFYYLMQTFGMIDNHFGISIIYAAVSMPSTIIFFKGFYHGFLNEIEEAAKIDGANEIQRYFSIIIPNSVSMIFALVLIQFMGYWNEFAITNMLITETELKTVSITLMSTSPDEYSYSMALLVLSAIPSFIFFTVFQKQIINSNLTMGAIKG